MLALAWCEKQRFQGLNSWNKAERELSLARLAQASCKVRLARATLWANTVEKLCKQVEVHNSKANDTDRGLYAPEFFRPPLDMVDRSFQILLLKSSAVKAGSSDSKLVIGCTLAAFRGSVVKTKSGETVRAGKPATAYLPASSTRVLHVSALQRSEQPDMPNVFWTAACCPPLVLDPTNCVLGELHVLKAYREGMRMFVELSPAAMQALTNLNKPNAKLPEVEMMDSATQADAAPSAPQPNVTTFDERSFSKTHLSARVPVFLDGLRLELERIGLVLVDADGYVQVTKDNPDHRVKWSELRHRAATFLHTTYQGLA